MAIKRLYIDQMFKHFDRTFTFEKGLTGVIGPNESGKSLLMEAIRYALFGTKALRGEGEDYKKLHVELDFEVAGIDFTVVRKGSRASLTGGTEASGTRPVNEAIQRILGYDLTVFDVANACNQGNVEALSDMRPAERKAMVDQTVGLNVLDTIIQYCGTEGNGLKREAEAFARAMVEPTEPEQPGNYTPSSSGEARLKELRQHRDEWLSLKSALAHAPEKPKAPKTCKVKMEASELQEILNNRELLKKSIDNTRRQIEALELPVSPLEDLEVLEAEHDAADRWQAKQRLLKQGEHECPECGHTWPVADLGDLADAKEIGRPTMSRNEIQRQKGLHENFRREAELSEREAGFREALAELPDVSDDLETREQWEAEMRTYERQLAAYNKYAEGLEERQARFEELDHFNLNGAVEALEYEVNLFQDYERDRARYEADLKKFETNKAEHDRLIARSEAFLSSRTAVQDLKVRIKTHLLPSLNKVASHLLSQMTGGERYKVDVDADFEIRIDDQKLGTLSGSGKAVANLAVRIALGQILTNRVFSVFIADEIDASMDDERAAHTAEALRRLTQHVGQVIQVTHKRPETDYTIELKK